VFLTSTVDKVKVLKMLKQLVTRPGSHCDMRPSWIITDYHKRSIFAGEMGLQSIPGWSLSRKDVSSVVIFPDEIYRRTLNMNNTYTQCPGKNAPPPKQNAVKCTIYNTIQ